MNTFGFNGISMGLRFHISYRSSPRCPPTIGVQEYLYNYQHSQDIYRLKTMRFINSVVNFFSQKLKVLQRYMVLIADNITEGKRD